MGRARAARLHGDVHPHHLGHLRAVLPLELDQAGQLAVQLAGVGGLAIHAGRAVVKPAASTQAKHDVGMPQRSAQPGAAPSLTSLRAPARPQQQRRRGVSNRQQPRRPARPSPCVVDHDAALEVGCVLVQCRHHLRHGGRRTAGICMVCDRQRQATAGAASCTGARHPGAGSHRSPPDAGRAGRCPGPRAPAPTPSSAGPHHITQAMLRCPSAL